MSSQLKIEDKDKILRGIIKKVGDKPYENGYWGTNVARDFLCVQLYDDRGTLIEYRNIDGSTDSVEIDTDDIVWTLDQYSRNRSIAEFTLVKKV